MSHRHHHAQVNAPIKILSEQNTRLDCNIGGNVNQQNMINVNFAPVNNNKQNFVNANNQIGSEVDINIQATLLLFDI